MTPVKEFATTKNFNELYEALRSKDQEVIEAVASNPYANHEIVALASRMAAERACRVLIQTHTSNKEIDFPRIVAQSDNPLLMGTYIDQLSRTHEAETKEASDMLQAMNPTTHHSLWSILDTCGLLMDTKGSDLTRGAKAIFLFAAMVGSDKGLLRHVKEIASKINNP